MTPQEFAEGIQSSLSKWNLFGATTYEATAGDFIDPQKASAGSDSYGGPFQAAWDTAKKGALLALDPFGAATVAEKATATGAQAAEGAARIGVEAARSVGNGISSVFTTVKVLLVVVALIVVLWALGQAKYAFQPQHA